MGTVYNTLRNSSSKLTVLTVRWYVWSTPSPHPDYRHLGLRYESSLILGSFLKRCCYSTKGNSPNIMVVLVKVVGALRRLRDGIVTG